jgi:predicted tellurium resistance membrane protein TerC
LGGGLFLIYKSTTEIHDKLEGEDHHDESKPVRHASFTGVIAQILLLDIVFSLDSVITAVGMAEDIEVMIAAVVIAVLVMLVASGPLSEFVSTHPTVKMLALSFLLLIGTSLVAEGWGFHISKGYIYAAMAFSVFVEILNLRMRSKGEKPVELRNPERTEYEAEIPVQVATAE